MNRGKKVVLVSHCILNQNSVVRPYGKKSEDFKDLLIRLIEENIGIVQLPCPEISMYGLKRWGHVKDQFETPHFKKQSKLMIENILDNIIEYKNNKYDILGVIGIKRSPSCGITKTCRGDWNGSVGGEDIKKKLESIKEVDEMGVFMEILKKSLSEIDIDVDFYDDFDRFMKTL
jgi:predicted secreted protein